MTLQKVMSCVFFHSKLSIYNVKLSVSRSMSKLCVNKNCCNV